MKVLAALLVPVVAVVALLVIGVAVLGVAGSLSQEPTGTTTPTGDPTTAPALQVHYDPVRLSAGLVAAAWFLGSAATLVRRTDWSAVGEAAAPQVDAAEYADLDAIVAALAHE